MVELEDEAESEKPSVANCESTAKFMFSDDEENDSVDCTPQIRKPIKKDQVIEVHPQWKGSLKRQKLLDFFKCLFL